MATPAAPAGGDRVLHALRSPAMTTSDPTALAAELRSPRNRVRRLVAGSGRGGAVRWAAAPGSTEPQARGLMTWFGRGGPTGGVEGAANHSGRMDHLSVLQEGTR